MQTRVSEPSVLAYGYRDASGNPYVTVMWAPGLSMAAILPRIQVRFVVPEQGIEIEGSDLPVEITTGSGTAFAIRYKDTVSSRARFGGFVVIVNAIANDGDRKVKDFHEEATIPPALGAVPCELLFNPGGSYPIALYPPSLENHLNAAVWRVSRLNLESTDSLASAGTITYRGQFVVNQPGAPPVATRARLSLQGVNAELTVDLGKPQEATGTGECALGKVRGSFHTARMEALFAIQVSR